MMDSIAISPERREQLENYAQRHDQDLATALDEALATYLAWDDQEYREAVEGIQEGYADFKAGRTQSVEEVFEELRVKHGLPR